MQFDLHDETQLLYAFATDGMGYIYLLDSHRNVLAREMPTDESHGAHIAAMQWLLQQAKFS